MILFLSIDSTLLINKDILYDFSMSRRHDLLSQYIDPKKKCHKKFLHVEEAKDTQKKSHQSPYE